MNIYLHIPFCSSKCSYCHFYSVTSVDLIEAYIQAIINEIHLRIPRKISIDTLYFGGGTPSLLSRNQLQRLIQTVCHKSKKPLTEITIEANPESLTKQVIKAYRQIGINRLSIGVQTWNQTILRHMNRSRAVKKLPGLVKFAQEIGLVNINIDHIIAYPHMTPSTIETDIKQTLALKPTHISIYPLEIHPKTQIYAMKRAHLIVPTPEKRLIEQFALVQLQLLKAGYRHYEEFSFAFPGFECLHNLDFWKGRDYLGFGGSATSRRGNTITTNKATIKTYIERLSRNEFPPNKAITITLNQKIEINKTLKSRIIYTVGG